MTEAELQRGLDDRFLPFEPEFTGYRLRDGGAREEDFRAYETELDERLPHQFRRWVTSYNFGELAMGPTVFGASGDYLKRVMELNSDIVWWGGGGSRPAHLLLIANYDPYGILLNVLSGKVLAMDSEKDWRNATDIADDFDLFVRGIGTAFLLGSKVNDRDEAARDIVAAVGGDDIAYWRQLIG
ncbi:MAG: SMI1/KNR4 family protein [Pseudomonadota bacterium]